MKTVKARGYAGRLQAFSKAALLGLVLFSMVTWVPNVCSCLRAFLFVLLPSAALAIITPKCLFVFSNIIILFLATESKLSCEKEDSGVKELSEEKSDVSLVNNVGDDLQEEVTKKEDYEDATKLPTEELNRRVEDIIAKFNMEANFIE